MASIITHPVVPIAIALGLGRSVISSRLLIAGSLLTILPDADVISFILGIPYASDFGHRGFTHSLVFGLGIGLCFLPFAKILVESRKEGENAAGNREIEDIFLPPIVD